MASAATPKVSFMLHYLKVGNDNPCSEIELMFSPPPEQNRFSLKAFKNTGLENKLLTDFRENLNLDDDKISNLDDVDSTDEVTNLIFRKYSYETLCNISIICRSIKLSGKYSMHDVTPILNWYYLNEYIIYMKKVTRDGTWWPLNDSCPSNQMVVTPSMVLNFLQMGVVCCQHGAGVTYNSDIRQFLKNELFVRFEPHGRQLELVMISENEFRCTYGTMEYTADCFTLNKAKVKRLLRELYRREINPKMFLRN